MREADRTAPRADPGRVHPADRWLLEGAEPRLDDILDDTTLESLMARDSVARDQLMNLVWALRYAARLRKAGRGA
jgi:hypothetical protein